MSLQNQDPNYVPEETVRVAKAAFPKGNLAIQLRDELQVIYTDDQFSDLYSNLGQPAEAPWRLALVTILQFSENLSDREAADAVRSRIDWKYALGLELDDRGFDHSVLSKFRKRLLGGQAESRLLDILLEICCAKQLLKSRGSARTDSTHVLAKVRALSRLGNVIETMRLALHQLVKVAPNWLQSWMPHEWSERYGSRYEPFRLPYGKDKLVALAVKTGEDGYYLLSELYNSKALPNLTELATVETLRQIWLQQYWVNEGQIQWRGDKDLPPTSQMLASPYDSEARLGNKRQTYWTGYKVHVTEHCQENQGNLITQVETCKPNRRDNMQLDSIHQSLKAKGLLPSLHLVDAGYMDAELLVQSQQAYDIQLLGPALSNNQWQAKTQGAYDITDFEIDWKNKSVTCPNGQKSVSWTEARDHGENEVIRAYFSSKDCTPCLQRSSCTKAKKASRILLFRTQAQYKVLNANRQAQTTQEWQVLYRKRNGIEGTLSQAVRAFGLRRSRYLGHAKTHFQHIAIATALNVTRLAAWFDQKDREKTRVSALYKLLG